MLSMQAAPHAVTHTHGGHNRGWRIDKEDVGAGTCLGGQIEAFTLGAKSAHALSVPSIPIVMTVLAHTEATCAPFADDDDIISVDISVLVAGQFIVTSVASFWTQPPGGSYQSPR